MCGDDRRGILALGQREEHCLNVDHGLGIVTCKMHILYPFAVRLQFIYPRVLQDQEIGAEFRGLEH